MATSTIVVLEGDETGQELLEEGLRVLQPDVIGLELGFERFDLSLERRRATGNKVVYEAAAATREAARCAAPRRRVAPHAGAWIETPAAM